LRALFYLDACCFPDEKRTSPVSFRVLKVSRRYFTYAKYAPESMMSEKIKALHPQSRPKEENLNHHCVNVEKPFSG
jgi:hypothetical protein